MDQMKARIIGLCRYLEATGKKADGLEENLYTYSTFVEGLGTKGSREFNDVVSELVRDGVLKREGGFYYRLSDAYRRKKN